MYIYTIMLCEDLSKLKLKPYSGIRIKVLRQL